MDCHQCGHEGLPQSAKFCPECGTRLTDTPERAETHIRVSTRVGTGDATGLRVDAIHGSVKVVNHHLYIGDPSPELLQQIRAVKAVPMEVTRSTAESAERGIPALDQIPALEEQVNAVLDQVRTAELRGEPVEGVQVGSMRLSRVELLVKQAVLLKVEADQMFLDHLGRNRNRIDQARGRSPGSTFEIDLDGLMAGFDGEAPEAKLRESYALLQEAARIEPTNAEVLLHMAQVMDQLEHDPHETQRILLRVQNLLDPPRSDTDRFRLAQAKFLSATSGEYTHTEQLRSARDMFSQLGRTDWVQHCDDLLASQAPSNASFSEAPPFGQHSSDPAGFQPVGQWQAQLSNGETLMLGLLANGGMQGAHSQGMFGLSLPLAGQWHFDIASQRLWLEGLVGGVSPVTLQILIQGQQGGVYLGVGADGMQYYLSRLG
jgi:hypothetical protein